MQISLGLDGVKLSSSNMLRFESNTGFEITLKSGTILHKIIGELMKYKPPKKILAYN